MKKVLFIRWHNNYEKSTNTYPLLHDAKLPKTAGVETLLYISKTSYWSSPASGKTDNDGKTIGKTFAKECHQTPGWFSGTRTQYWGCSGAKWKRRAGFQWTSCWSRCSRRTHSDHRTIKHRKRLRRWSRRDQLATGWLHDELLPGDLQCLLHPLLLYPGQH